MKPETDQKQLNDLFAQAEFYAQSELRRSPSSITPAYLYYGEKGLTMAVTPGFETPQAKHRFVKMVRLIGLAHSVTAGVVITGTWLRFYAADEPVDSGESLTEAIDRQEFVLLGGECRSSSRRKLLPVVRYDNGTFHGFGEPDIATEFQGWSPKFLPNQTPSAEMCLAAKKALLEWKCIALC